MPTPAETHGPTESTNTAEPGVPAATESAGAVPDADVAAETPDAAPPDDLRAEVERLRAELAEQREAAERYLRNWQRAQADFANFKRRAEQERNEHVRRASEEFIAAVLPVLDDLERAFLSLPPELLSLTWLEGIALIDRKLRAELEAHGLVEIAAAGEPFDPALHEAVMQEEVESERAGQVLAVFQRGYRLGDRVLRPALVKVGAPRRTQEPAAPDTGASAEAAPTPPDPESGPSPEAWADAQRSRE